jgi:hypothetical protein
MTGAITVFKRAKDIKSKYRRWGSTVCIVGSLAIYGFAFNILGRAHSLCFAGDINFSVCEQVSVKQLTSICQVKLFPVEQERGCQWRNNPSGIPYFQIGIIESHNNLRQFFEKELPANYSLMKVNDIGDRGLMTVSGEYLSAVVIRDGNWVLISTLNNIKIKMNSVKHDALWDIYRGVLHKLR